MSHELASSAPIESLPNNVLAHVQSEHGSMSLRPLHKLLEMFATSRNSAEVTDFQLDDSPQALMAGQVLLSSLEKQARELGITELLVTSGPDAKETTIKFWNIVLGPHIAISEDHFSPNEGALVWRMQITND